MDEQLAALQKRDVEDRNLAAYCWQIRRCPPFFVEGEEPDTEVLLAEYDVHGKMHHLDEIALTPPYLFCLISSREGVPNRFVRIDPGWTYVYHHRVRGSMRLGLAAPYQHLDCIIFGVQNLADTRFMNLMIVYPDGLAYGPFFSLQDAHAHAL